MKCDDDFHELGLPVYALNQSHILQDFRFKEVVILALESKCLNRSLL
jgi:hypothetical protein